MNVEKLVRFEFFTAVTMKNVVFWDVALCRPWVNRRFGGAYGFHLQGRKIRADFSTLKMEANPGSTQRHIPEDDTLRVKACFF
jgi:hypothetical protein